MMDTTTRLETIKAMKPPPRILDSTGRAVPTGDELDRIDDILKEGPNDGPLLPRRAALTLVAIAAIAAVALTLGLGGTGASSGPREAAPADQAARQLKGYAEDALSGSAPFPPEGGGSIVATMAEPGVYRITSRGLDGSCWQVLAYTRDSESGDETLVRIETVPYITEPIHCRFNS